MPQSLVTAIRQKLADFKLSKPSKFKPFESFGDEGAQTMRSLAWMSVALGYLGTLLTQSLTFVGSDFDAGTREQSTVLAVGRVDFVIAMIVAAFADRRGRRGALLISVGSAALLTTASGLAPSLVSFATMQVLTHCAMGAGTILVAVLAAESVNKETRAYAMSLLAVAGGLGAGICTVCLPIADLSDGSWRALYIVGIVALLPTLRARRRLPESRRFMKRNAAVPLRGHISTLALLALGGLLITLFVTPAVGLRNDWLRDQRAFSAADLVAYNVVAYLPALLGIVVGGRLADIHGRRIVASIGVAGTVLATWVSYQASGGLLWVSSALAGCASGAIIPALSVYGPELFPTALRGLANGVINGARSAGAVVGLVAVPLIAESSSFANAFTYLALGPACLVVLLIVAYPETAHRSLEELNPEDGTSERVAEDVSTGAQTSGDRT